MGYHLTFSTEGNALGKVVRCSSNVDCLNEFGRTIRITHRTLVKSVVIQSHDYGFQLDSLLKTER